jgi:hypothetical protein
MIWIAYCKDCQKEIDRAPNGIFVECAGKRHIRENNDHKIIIGYEIKKEEK